MAARIKGKMERTSSWSYLCRRIGFLTAAPRVVQPRRIAAQDWLSHSKLSISRQSQNNSFPLKVYTSVASSKLYNCYVFIFVYILFDRPNSKLWKVAWSIKIDQSQKRRENSNFQESDLALLDYWQIYDKVKCVCFWSKEKKFEVGHWLICHLEDLLWLRCGVSDR